MPSVVIYARVSTNEGRQHTDVQVHACEEYATQHGWTVRKTYRDTASARDLRGRRAWRQMLADLQGWKPRTRPQAVVVVHVDRVARRLDDYVQLRAAVEELDVVILATDGSLGRLGEQRQPLDRAAESLQAVFAELSRDEMVLGIKRGQDAARRRGKHIGRPPVAIDWEAWERLAAGLSLRQRALALGVAVSTLRRAEIARSLHLDTPEAMPFEPSASVPKEGSENGAPSS